ncbi:MAG: phosphoesterase [Acidobacteriota bacterium]|nr:phosphoesterase [Blastocatellia bacterium]MDW8411613.1 phosphoesterase [Acidobacteriota bacterium]
MKTKIMFHNNCFDGVASAVVFSDFYQSCVNSSAQLFYKGLAHKAGQIFDEGMFDGDENVIVDFKYSRSPRLTWWFDHHQSAFLTKDDELHYLTSPDGKACGRKFIDPTFRSCTKYIATVVKDLFKYSNPTLSELITWADIIDGALYPDAQTAVELNAPALRLMLVIESTRDERLIESIIRDLRVMSLEEIVKQDYIAAVLENYLARHYKAIDVIREHATCKGSVVYFDISSRDVEGYNKFIPYYLYPDTLYSVGVSRSPHRSKISVGFNPWAKMPRQHNLASICEKYGGGGHAVVGAISYGPEELDKARAVALEVVEQLNS